jgi:hypothetical protein
VRLFAAPVWLAIVLLKMGQDVGSKAMIGLRPAAPKWFPNRPHGPWSFETAPALQTASAQKCLGMIADIDVI